MGLNFVLTFGTLAVGMVVAFIATAPDFPVLAMTVGFMAASVALPLFFYPFTNTIWLAVDLLAHQPEAAELTEAAQVVAATARD